MDTQKIRFIANRPWLKEESPSRPVPMVKTIPDWYRQADRHAKDPATGEYWQMPDIGGKVPTWKACPAVFDIMGSGYTYLTPCDIEFAEDAGGNIQCRALDPKYRHFLIEREPMPGFVHPPGYHLKHFAWWPDWAIELPAGYSALYAQPFNRYDLPFLTTSGIVDNDKIGVPGSMPFFVLKGVSGVLPAGTPYAQILPFKREHWASEVEVSLTPEQLQAKNDEARARYRRPDGGIYLKEDWERRKYQ